MTITQYEIYIQLNRLKWMMPGLSIEVALLKEKLATNLTLKQVEENLNETFNKVKQEVNFICFDLKSINLIAEFIACYELVNNIENECKYFILPHLETCFNLT